MKTNHVRAGIALAAAVAAVGLGHTAKAADKYWDINGANAGATDTTAASGTWDAASTNWNATADGTGAPTTFAAGDHAIFSAGSNATGASTIAGTSTRNVSGLTIEEGTVIFNTGTIAVGLNGQINVNAGAVLETNTSARIGAAAGENVTYRLNNGTLRTTNAGSSGSFVDVDASIVLNGGGTIDYGVANVLNIIQTSTGISGTGPLTKTGQGVLALAGPGTWTGATIVNGGELRIRTSNNRLPVATDVTVNGTGILNLNGLSQQIASLSGTGNVGTGAGTLTINGTATTTFDGALKNIASYPSGATTGGVTTGDGRLVKSGTGAITFNGLNDLSGSVTLNNGGITVSPTGSLAGDAADLAVNGGTLTLNNAAETIRNLSGTGGSIVLGTGHTLTSIPADAANTTNASAISGPGGLAFNKAGAKLTLNGTNTYTGGTTMQAGTLAVRRLHENNPVTVNGGKLQVVDSSPTLPAHPSGDSAFVSRPSSLTIANNGAAIGSRTYSGQLDLGNNDLILDYDGASPLADIEDMVRGGYNGGDWLGNGIASSTANANRNFAIGVADNSLLTIPFSASRPFSGQTVDTSTILVKFTHRIDLDLDGVITTNDATIFNSNYSEGAPARWSIGDLDYDRVFTTNDATLFNSFYSEALPTVPEPATLGVLAIGAIGLLGRRRRVG